MKKRKLLQSGLLVSEVGLGCMSFANFYGATNERESHETLFAAMDFGLDFLDTASLYGWGLSEEIIGSFIKDHKGHFKIATKAGIARDLVTGVRCFDNSYAHLKESLENSLKRLGVDSIELFYIHRRDQREKIEDVMESLLSFKREGKIQGIGFSEIAPTSLQRACKVGHVDAVQSEYSLWTRYPELGLLKACEDLNVAFIPFSPLGRGVLTDQFPNPKKFGKEDFRKDNPRFTEPNYGMNLEKLKLFRTYASDMGYATSALAIAWNLAKGKHLIPIPGTRSKKHLLDFLGASEMNLNREKIEEIEKILPLGWAHGDRYSQKQWSGIEKYC